MSQRKNGVFIAFEGLDGSGQTTEAKLLRDFLTKLGFRVVLTKEPTLDSEAGKKIRKVLDKKIKMRRNRIYSEVKRSVQIRPEELQNLFAKDRKEHLKKTIIPTLKQGKIVISDRYLFSSLAYGAASGVNLNWLIKINKKFLLPDLTFILKVSPKICLKRIKKRGNFRTLFEEEKKLARVWQVYKTFPKRFKNVKLINGEKTIKQVFSQIRTCLWQKY